MYPLETHGGNRKTLNGQDALGFHTEPFWEILQYLMVFLVARGEGEFLQTTVLQPKEMKLIIKP